MTNKQPIDLSWFDAKKHQPYATHKSFIDVKDMLQNILDNQENILHNQEIIMSVINADKKFKDYVNKAYIKKKISMPKTKSKTKAKEQAKIQQSVEESEIF